MIKYITLENHNPTEAEKLMYKRHGLYLVKRTNNTYEYNIVHFQDYDNFKEILKVEEDVVDKDSKVIFNDDGTITIQNLDYLIVTGGTGESRFDMIEDALSGLTVTVIKGNENAPDLPFVFSNVRGYYMSAYLRLLNQG